MNVYPYSSRPVKSSIDGVKVEVAWNVNVGRTVWWRAKIVGRLGEMWMIMWDGHGLEGCVDHTSLILLGSSSVAFEKHAVHVD